MKEDDNPPDELVGKNLLKTSGYSSSFAGIGDNMSATLHQSYINNNFDNAISIDTVNQNNFTIPCPKDVNFNTSYTNFTLKDITAPNKSLEIELDTFGTVVTPAHNVYLSFNVTGTGYLKNVSLHLRKTGALLTELSIYLFNATYDIGKGYYVPDTDLYAGVAIVDDEPIASQTYYWEDMNTGFFGLCNTSETDEGVFFLKLQTGGSHDIQLNGTLDTGNGDGSDDSIVLDNNYDLIRDGFFNDPVDAALKVGLMPLNNTPNPEHINMKINDEIVKGYSNLNGSGYWESFIVNGSNSGSLKYNVTADWWDVECTIAKVHANYTKTNFNGTTNYNVATSGDWVYWNCTLDIDNFDYRIKDNLYANVSIPSFWDENFKISNSTYDDLTSSSINRTLGNGYREIQVFNAYNDTWVVETNSTNNIGSIDLVVGTTHLIDTPPNVNSSNNLHFNATMVKYIQNNDGIFNTSVFSPTSFLNFTQNETIFTGGIKIDLVNWTTINENITEYGQFLIQMTWENGTSVGFLEKDMVILGETEIKSLTRFPDTPFYNASQTFNITVQFNDTKDTDSGIAGANITYKLNDNLPKPTDENVKYIGEGKYNISFDCNDTDFYDAGINTITFNITKKFYNNQSNIVQIVIYAETKVEDQVRWPQKSSFTSQEYINVSVYFNNTVRKIPIDGANITVKANGKYYTSDLQIDDTLPNDYINFTIDCGDPVFDGYGSYTIEMTINKTYYYNESLTPINIDILGITDIDYVLLPDKPYYNSEEIFNVSIYYNDTALAGVGISGATVNISVDDTQYASNFGSAHPYIYDNKDGWYNITMNCSDPLFSSYGEFNISFDLNKSNYQPVDDFTLKIVVGNTTLRILDPAYDSEYFTGIEFNITIEYEDRLKSTGIDSADIDHEINNKGFKGIGVNVTEIGNGQYNITINMDDPDFDIFGLIDIRVRANKTNYNNLTIDFRINRIIATTIKPGNDISMPNIYRGQQNSLTFNYSSTSNQPIPDATWDNVSDDYGLKPTLQNEGNGNYTMVLSTTGINTGAYIYIFNVSAPGNQTQEISLTFTILEAQTQVIVDSYNSVIPVYVQGNNSIRFRMYDTTISEVLLGLDNSKVSVRDLDGDNWGQVTGDHNYTLHDYNNDGNYSLDITTRGLGVGTYTAVIDVDLDANHAAKQFSITFQIRGAYMSANLISVEDPGGVIESTSEDLKNYTAYINSDLTISFNLTEDEFGDSLIIGSATYNVKYVNLLNSSDTGTILYDLEFEDVNETYGFHTGLLNLSYSLNRTGTYEITINITKTNYEWTTLTLIVNIQDKLEARIELYDVPSEVNVGEEFVIKLRILFRNGSDWVPLGGAEVEIETHVVMKSAATFTNSTDDSGIVSFSLVIPSDAENFSISVNLGLSYKFKSEPIEISDIILLAAVGFIAIEIIILILILFGSISAVSVSGVAVNKFVIAPKKREKRRVLTEVKTLFEDAINLEHILVLYKGTGTCIFFKSYGTEEIDPELIGGFLSAVSSFGREMVAQEALNEISYGDKMLLLADGTHIRVALVLSKQASMILRAHLKEFIDAFEDKYKGVLPKWRGQLKFFRDAGELVDSILNTSVILPHELKYETSDVKKLKKPQSKELLKITDDLLQTSGRNFFFIATLLNEAIENTGRSTAQIFMGIQELKDKGILKPLDITEIEKAPVSKQEIGLINQKVNELTSLAGEEREKVVQDLIKMSPSEREIYLSSLKEQEEIITAPIESKVGTETIKDVKSAKKAIKKLKKKGKKFAKKKIYDYAKENYHNAQKLAADWELKKQFDDIDEKLRQLYKIELDESLKIREIDAANAIKASNFGLAQEKYVEAITIANDIFKLGFDEISGKIEELKKERNKIPSLAGEEEVTLEVPISKEGIEELKVGKPPQEVPEAYDIKAAKKDIKELRKDAISARKSKEYSKALELNEKALSIAKKWNVADQVDEISEETRKISLHELDTRLKEVSKEANSQFKSKEYESANQLYLEASSIASEMFKLGATEMDSEVKKYTNKANECTKLIEEAKAPTEKKLKVEKKPKKILEKPKEEPEEGDIIVKDAKTAKKEIKILRKTAHSARKKRNFSKAVESYQSAIKLAKVWEISDILPELENQIRLTNIEDLQIQLKSAESKAEKAEKNKIYPEAQEMYGKASQIASEIFKLGVLEMDKEVKRLTNKAKEFENI